MFFQDAVSICNNYIATLGIASFFTATNQSRIGTFATNKRIIKHISVMVAVVMRLVFGSSFRFRDAG